jgi:methyl-accepting chemotaxis protein
VRRCNNVEKNRNYFILGVVGVILILIYVWGGTSGSGELYNAIRNRISGLKADNSRAEELVQSADSTIGEVASGIGNTNDELGRISEEIGNSAEKSRTLSEQIGYCREIAERNEQLIGEAESIFGRIEQRNKTDGK